MMRFLRDLVLIPTMWRNACHMARVDREFRRKQDSLEPINTKIIAKLRKNGFHAEAEQYARADEGRIREVINRRRQSRWFRLRHLGRLI